MNELNCTFQTSSVSVSTIRSDVRTPVLLITTFILCVCIYIYIYTHTQAYIKYAYTWFVTAYVRMLSDFKSQWYVILTPLKCSHTYTDGSSKLCHLKCKHVP
jgi:hypothetical protein